MKTEHTPEPWRIGRFTGPGSYEKVRETCGAMDVVVDTDSGPYVLAGCNINFPDDAKANARRIVACVNACAGLPTEVLERYKLGIIGVDYKLTKQQRDGLLAALERSLESFEYIAKYGNSCGHSQLRIPDLKAVIASVEGET